jgi:hypothetical protein
MAMKEFIEKRSFVRSEETRKFIEKDAFRRLPIARFAREQ